MPIRQRTGWPCPPTASTARHGGSAPAVKRQTPRPPLPALRRFKIGKKTVNLLQPRKSPSGPVDAPVLDHSSGYRLPVRSVGPVHALAHVSDQPADFLWVGRPGEAGRPIAAGYGNPAVIALRPGNRLSGSPPILPRRSGAILGACVPRRQQRRQQRHRQEDRRQTSCHGLRPYGSLAAYGNASGRRRHESFERGF